MLLSAHVERFSVSHMRDVLGWAWLGGNSNQRYKLFIVIVFFTDLGHFMMEWSQSPLATDVSVTGVKTGIGIGLKLGLSLFRHTFRKLGIPIPTHLSLFHICKSKLNLNSICYCISSDSPSPAVSALCTLVPSTGRCHITTMAGRAHRLQMCCGITEQLAYTKYNFTFRTSVKRQK